MPLKIEFKNGDKLMINGAVIENVGANAKILVHNEASILRNKEVLSEQENLTPASRVYMALQCAYMFPDQKDQYVDLFNRYLGDYLAACPSASALGEQIREQLGNGKTYKALKLTQDLIRHEAGILQKLHQDVAHYIDDDGASETGGVEAPPSKDEPESP